MWSLLFDFCVFFADPLSLSYYIGSGVLGAMRNRFRLALIFASASAVAVGGVIWLLIWIAIPTPISDEWRYACYEREWLYDASVIVHEGGLVFFPARVIIGVLVAFVAYCNTPVLSLRRYLAGA